MRFPRRVCEHFRLFWPCMMHVAYCMALHWMALGPDRTSRILLDLHIISTRHDFILKSSIFKLGFLISSAHVQFIGSFLAHSYVFVP